MLFYLSGGAKEEAKLEVVQLAPDVIPKEHETPLEETFIPKDDTIMGWSVHVVKMQQYKIILVLKVGEQDNFTWTTVTNWDVMLVQAWGTTSISPSKTLHLATLTSSCICTPRETSLDLEIIKSEPFL